MLESHPLSVMTVDEATQAQFRLVEIASRHLPDGQILTNGDLGLAALHDGPHTTRQVEHILAEYFGAEAAILVRGSGTGAIREAFFVSYPPNSTVIFHRAPIYYTTNVTVQAMAIRPHLIDFNCLDSGRSYVNIDAAGAFVQHSRQRPTDAYDLGHVVGSLRDAMGDKPIVTDDNYAVLKTARIGSQLGADLSTFSVFKLLGPEGIGAIVGRQQLINQIHGNNRSGGAQIQGHEAMDTLRGAVYVPVAAAIQATVTQRVATRLNSGEVPGVASAIAANAEETVVLVQLDRPNAKVVIRRAAALGAAPHPVGAESRYELAPMFYRVSKAALVEHPEWSETVVRINPSRAGDDHIIAILHEAIRTVGRG